MRDALLKRAAWATLLSAVALAGLWALRSTGARPETPADGQRAQPSESVLPSTLPSPNTAPAEGLPDGGQQHARSTPVAPEPNDAAELSAAELTQRAKSRLALDPAAALRDIQAADAIDDTAGTAHEERRALEIHAWVRLGKVGLARTLTDHFYHNFPDSERARELERLTGYHPRPGPP